MTKSYSGVPDEQAKAPKLEDKFTVVMNPADEGQMWFEHQETLAYPPQRVWTVVEGDNGNLYAITGYHIVNVVYYAITEEAWTAEDEPIDYLWFDYEEMST